MKSPGNWSQRFVSFFNKHGYASGSSAIILVWLFCWLVCFRNIYGWLTDDIYQFTSRVLGYETGGNALIDIQWFHAFDWLIVTPVWLFHWQIPSYEVPQAWANTGQFRALILFVIILHAGILGLLALFLRTICRDRRICITTLLLFATSPTFVFYADLLDSRYLGLLTGLPAFTILFHFQSRLGKQLPPQARGWPFALAGFLIGIGQSLHYTLLYFAAPTALVFWAHGIITTRSRLAAIRFVWFSIGVVAWFLPVELLSLRFHPFFESMLGVLTHQAGTLKSDYGKAEDLATWLHFFYEEMGVPMIVASIAGMIIVLWKRSRPSTMHSAPAVVSVVATVLAIAYLAATPEVAFYRQLSMYQIFFALTAVIAADRLAATTKFPTTVFAGLMIAIAFVPSIVRMPEVFMAAQGLGRAVNTAHRLATDRAHVSFIEFYDSDLHPNSIISREDFAQLDPHDYVVTVFPTFFFAKYPDIFALFHDTAPIASYPTEWCTHENWVEERTYWNFRRYHDEPLSCNAEVYSVAALRNEAAGIPVHVRSVQADSTLSADYEPREVFALHHPAVPMTLGTRCCNTGPIYRPLWASKPTYAPHWIEVRFDHPIKLHAVTIVPVNYFSPPDYTAVGRPASARVFALDSKKTGRLLWEQTGLRDKAIFTASFSASAVDGVRIELLPAKPERLSEALILHQRLATSATVGIEYVRFPGYRIISSPEPNS